MNVCWDDWRSERGSSSPVRSSVINQEVSRSFEIGWILETVNSRNP
jgi:hypothetical protein